MGKSTAKFINKETNIKTKFRYRRQSLVIVQLITYYTCNINIQSCIIIDVYVYVTIAMLLDVKKLKLKFLNLSTFLKIPNNTWTLELKFLKYT